MAQKPQKMTEDQLKALVDMEVQQSMGYVGRLSEQRRTALEYYLNRPSGKLAPPEVDGRSAVVSPDVANAIEWAMPSLMRIFTSGEDIARFAARKPQDEDKAAQATEYCNWLLWAQNEGYRVVYWWLKDALLSKNGYVKVYTEEKKEVTREEYEDQTIDQVHVIMQPNGDDEEVELVEKSEEPDESFLAQLPQMQQQFQQAQEQYQQAQMQVQQMQAQAQQGDQRAQQTLQQMMPQLQQMEQQLQQMQQHMQNVPMQYDITIKRIRTTPKTIVENVPPEEILVSRRAKTIEDTPFIAHRVRKRIGELVAMGYDLDTCLTLTDDNNWAQYNSEAIMRRVYDDEAATQYEDGGNNDPMGRYVWLIDAYVQVDYDNDGILEWRRILKAGATILENEVKDGHPFADLSPILMPHRHFGLSLADISMDFQTIKTQLLRQYLDALYIGNTPRYEVVEGQVNLDDMLTSRVGGLVRVKAPGMISPLQTQDISQSAQAGLEYFSQMTDERTGITKYNQGLDSNTLNQTATGIDLIQQSAMQRLELMARTMAETGFRRLFKLLLKESIQYQNREQVVKLTGKWVAIDPREWRNGFDLTIDVGLGTGNREAQAKQLMNILTLQGQLQQFGIATPQNIYYTASKIPQALGHKDSDQFFTDPSKGQAPQQPNPEMVKGQMAMQVQQAKAQADMQIKQMELQHSAQLEQAKMQQSAQLEQMKLQLQMQSDAAAREHEAKLDALRAQMQAHVDDNKQQAQAAQVQLQLEQEAKLKAIDAQIAENARMSEQAFNQWKAKLDNETKVLVAQISAAASAAKAEPSEPAGASSEPSEATPQVDVAGALQAALQGFTEALQAMSKPKTLIRGADGKVVGIQ
jgi:hypothetical protein